MPRTFRIVFLSRALILLAIFLFTPMPTAFAISIDFAPAFHEVTVGERVRVDLVVSDLIPGTDVIGDFRIGTKFDSVILNSTIETLPTDIVFGPHLGIPGTEATAVWGVIEDIETDVVVTQEISYLRYGALATLQGSSFVLGSLYFDAIAPGISPLEFTYVSLGGPFLFNSSNPVGPGPRLEVASLRSGSITSIPVPEPSTLLLFASGLVGLALTSRRCTVVGREPMDLQPFTLWHGKCLTDSRIEIRKVNA